MRHTVNTMFMKKILLILAFVVAVVVSYMAGRHDVDGGIVPVERAVVRPLPPQRVQSPAEAERLMFGGVDVKSVDTSANRVSDEDRRQMHEELKRIQAAEREAGLGRLSGYGGYGSRIGRALSENSYVIPRN